MIFELGYALLIQYLELLSNHLFSQFKIISKKMTELVFIYNNNKNKMV